MELKRMEAARVAKEVVAVDIKSDTEKSFAFLTSLNFSLNITNFLISHIIN